MSEKPAITVGKLRDILRRHPERDHEELSVLIALPSVGPRACVKVTDAMFGFDWDRGLQFRTEERLVPKNDKQDVFESAFELIAYLATKPVKRKSYEQDKAERILRKYGCDDEKLAMYRRVFHRKVES